MARAEALQHAEIAFEKADKNGDGVIDKEEALKIIDQADSFGKSHNSNSSEERKMKVDEFFRSFDEDGD